MESGNTELVGILLVMLFLFLIGVGASAIFIRQWRREKKSRRK
jgi:hypothetical protein